MAIFPGPQPQPRTATESRKFYRVRLNMPVEVKVPGFAVKIPGTLADLSEGGCLLKARAMVNKGAVVEFSLNAFGKQVPITATLRNINYRNETREFEYGLQFEKMRPADQDAVYHFIVEQQRRDIHDRNAEKSAPASAIPQKGNVVKRGAYRVEHTFPIRYNLDGQSGTWPAMALDVSTGGMRVALGQKIPVGRDVTIRFTLPHDVLAAFGESKARAFQELAMHARVLPGVQQLKERYLYNVAFDRARAFETDEIQRFVNAAQVVQIQRQRAS